MSRASTARNRRRITSTFSAVIGVSKVAPGGPVGDVEYCEQHMLDLAPSGPAVERASESSQTQFERAIQLFQRSSELWRRFCMEKVLAAEGHEEPRISALAFAEVQNGHRTRHCAVDGIGTVDGREEVRLRTANGADPQSGQQVVA